jgi:uncharacterized membrane protein YdbT with pleckstrin-like domain
MAYPQKLLAPDETIEFETRPHWRALFAPIVVLLATIFGMVFLVVPFLRWLTTEYTFTDRRIIVRAGIITRTGKDMPLAKVNNVSFSVPMMGRVLNYGELVIQSAGENEGLTIEDVPDVEEIQRHIYELIESDEKRRRGHE